MAIELNGTTGITTPDITSEAGLTVDGVSFASGAPANTLVTTSGGNVGIGTSSPDERLTVTATNPTDGRVMSLRNNATSGLTGTKLWFNQNTVDNWNIGQPAGVNAFVFCNSAGSATERARIDSSGNLLVGTTSTMNGVGSDGKIGLQSSGASGNFVVQTSVDNNIYLAKVSGYTNSTFIRFSVNGTGVGSITTNGTNTTYATSSDYRLKENVVGVTGASARVQQLNPVRFNFIADPDTTVDGFLAHEVQDVVPEAITGTKDATEMVDVHDEDGNVTGQEERPVYQGIDQSKLVPLLTAALQEALGKIETLEARVAALEAA